jgi:hypothetical protein
MEKIKSVLSIITGIIFIMVAVLIFSCEEKRKIEETTMVSGDTITTLTKEVTTDSLRPNWKEESNAMKERLDKLGSKAKQKGGELGKEINKGVDKLEADRKKFINDSTKNDFKEKWKTFKEKTNTAIDSLDKKFDEKMNKKK